MAAESSTSTENKSDDADHVEVQDGTSTGRRSINVCRGLALAIVLFFIAVVIAVIGVLCSDIRRKFINQRGVQHHDTDEEIVTESAISVQNYIERLPGDVVPETYLLHIRPFIYEDDIEGVDRHRFQFDGRVIMNLRCVTATDEIVLHFLGLTVFRASIWSDAPGADQLRVVSIWFDHQHSFMHISLSQRLQPGSTYYLGIDFLGQINDYSYGIYDMSYLDEDGNERLMLASHMEPLGARHVLPCFDEPAMKAVFNISITHRSDMTALSNGQETDVVDHLDGWSTTTFAPTPVMSTYLLAIVIGDLNYTENITASGVRLRLWSVPNAVHTTSFSLQASSILLTYFEDYFNITYQMPKLDMVAVPELWPYLAMENWGLVIYREEYLLYDPEVDTFADQTSILDNVAHELAHQWIGNYVTMSWWNELWLNEGFAAFFGHFGTDVFMPELKVIEQLVSKTFQDMLDGDAKLELYPIIRQQVDEDSIFNWGIYVKGAAVVRMMHNVLGEDVFREGLQLYLNNFSYGNVESDDLWNALTEADRGHGNIDVKQWMDTWSLQSNYPVVNLRRLNRTAVRAQQERYIVDWSGEAAQGPSSPFGYTWHIYLTHTHNRSKTYGDPPSLWLTDDNPHEFSLGSTITADDWYLANIDAYGVYRVNYDLDNWRRLISQLASDHEAIPTLSRVQLLGDSFGLAMSGHLPFEVPLDLARYLGDEISSAPWNVARRFFDKLRDLLEETALRDSYQIYLHDITGALFQRLILDNTQNNTSVDQTRTLAIVRSLACRARHTECIRHVFDVFQDYVAAYRASPQSPVLTMRFVPESEVDILCLAIRTGGQAAWRSAWSLYKTKNMNMTSTSVDMWLKAMACTQNVHRIKRLLYYPMRSGNLTDTVYALRNIPSTPVGRRLAWEFLRQYWDALYETYSDSYELEEIINDVTDKFHTNQRLKELKSFAASRDLGSGSYLINEAIKTTKENIAQFNMAYPGIQTWFQDYDPL